MNGVRPDSTGASALLDVVKQISERRREEMQTMKACLLANDDVNALIHARALCGLTEAE